VLNILVLKHFSVKNISVKNAAPDVLAIAAIARYKSCVNLKSGVKAIGQSGCTKCMFVENDMQYNGLLEWTKKRFNVETDDEIKKCIAGLSNEELVKTPFFRTNPFCTKNLRILY